MKSSTSERFKRRTARRPVPVECSRTVWLEKFWIVLSLLKKKSITSNQSSSDERLSSKMNLSKAERNFLLHINRNGRVSWRQIERNSVNWEKNKSAKVKTIDWVRVVRVKEEDRKRRRRKGRRKEVGIFEEDHTIGLNWPWIAKCATQASSAWACSFN